MEWIIAVLIVWLLGAVSGWCMRVLMERTQDQFSVKPPRGINKRLSEIEDLHDG